MIRVQAVDPGQAGREGRGTNLNVLTRPQNPADQTVWTNPSTGLDEVYDNGRWIVKQVSGGLQAANNLSDLLNAGTARTNLGLGSMGVQNSNSVNLDGRVRLGGRVSTSTSYSMTSTDCTVFATGGAGGITVSLPAANTSGQIAIVVKVDAGVGVITVDAAGSDTIEGAADVTLSAQYDKCFLYSDGSGTWYRIV